jgi:hypothetical protein
MLLERPKLLHWKCHRAKLKLASKTSGVPTCQFSQLFEDGLDYN